jgi:hypothetical protein
MRKPKPKSPPLPGRYTSEDIHRAIFPQGTPASEKIEAFDKGMRRYIKKKQARR